MARAPASSAPRERRRGAADGANAGRGPDLEALEEAEQACRHLLPSGMMGDPNATMDPEMADQLLDFSKCMRDHGIDFPDPQFEGGGVTGSQMDEGIDPSSRRSRRPRRRAATCSPAVGRARRAAARHRGEAVRGLARRGRRARARRRRGRGRRRHRACCRPCPGPDPASESPASPPGGRGPDRRHRAADDADRGRPRRHARLRGWRRVAAGADGTVTRLPAGGTVIERGEVLYELDGKVRPRLLYGDRPLWRPLGPGMSDGADVLQLERNLKAMGYAPKGMEVDRHWSSKTTRAVKRWQKAIGAGRATARSTPRTSRSCPGRSGSRGAATSGRRRAGRPGPRRVERLAGRDARPLGEPPGPGGAGQAVSVELPDGTLVDGTIREVGRVATVDQGRGSTTVPVTIDLDPVGAAGPRRGTGRGPRGGDRHEDVLAVPVKRARRAARGRLRRGGRRLTTARGATSRWRPACSRTGWSRSAATASRPATPWWSRDDGSAPGSAAPRRAGPGHRAARRRAAATRAAARGRAARRRPRHRRRASCSRSSARRGRARRRCSTCSARSTGRRAARSRWPASGSTACPTGRCPRCGRGGSGSCSSTSTCWAARPALDNVADGLLYRGVSARPATGGGGGAGPGGASGIAPGTGRASCRAGSASGSRWPGRSSAGRRSSSRTSRPATSTRRPAPRSWTCSGTSTRPTARRSPSSPTTATSRRRCRAGGAPRRPVVADRRTRSRDRRPRGGTAALAALRERL